MNVSTTSRFRQILRRLPWYLTGFLVAALVIGIGASLWVFSAGTERYQLQFTELDIPERPSYVSSDFLTEVQELGGFEPTIDLRQSGLAARLHHAFGRHPWVEKVERITLLPRRRVVVDLHYRVPVAIVEVESTGTAAIRARQGQYLIDRHAILLPQLPADSELPKSLLPIRGMKKPPTGQPGSPWGSREIEFAAETAAIFGPERSRFQIAAIEVDRDPLLPDIRLRTAKGTQVIWTAIQETSGFQEVSVGEKLRRLQAYCADHGNLDSPAGPYLLDIRHAEGVLRKQLP